jgi:hypothetical protein
VNLSRHAWLVPFLGLALAGCDQFEDPDIAQIRAIEPDSGAIGSVVQIDAENLLDNTHVIFNEEVESPVTALFVDRVVTIVPEGATTGDVVLETGGERSSSRRSFTVLPAPPSTPAFFETQTGERIATDEPINPSSPAFVGGCPTNAPAGDDGAARVVLPFTFPFYGRPHIEMFVATNGIITFGEPRPCDNNGNTSDFATADKIAVVGFDLEPGLGGEVRVNASNAEKVIVTWSEVPLCALDETSNTFQAVLFPDGRIRANFGLLSTRGVSTACTADRVFGSIVGLAPLAASRLVQASFGIQSPLTIGPQDAVFEPFFVDRFFNLENRSLLFTPLQDAGVFNGYRVEVLP